MHGISNISLTKKKLDLSSGTVTCLTTNHQVSVLLTLNITITFGNFGVERSASLWICE